MSEQATAALARCITRESSRQTYFTILLLVDKELVDDCYRAYSYFRWADDVVDDLCETRDQRIAFIARQKALIDGFYDNERSEELRPEEDLIADLIKHERRQNSGLRSFIHNFMAILEFDADRKGRLISQAELTWYSDCLGKAVTDDIQYFIGNGHSYPDREDRYLAATAAHITHMLRDLLQDVSNGFINIPREYLEDKGIDPENITALAIRPWVREQVALARKYFAEGKRYLHDLDVLRCKIAGFWYCARFERILDTIERDGYILRPEYGKPRKISAWITLARLAASVALQHIVWRTLRRARTLTGPQAPSEKERAQ